MDQTFERDGMYVFQTTHRIHYNTEKPVPIKEMIIALQGLEGLLRLLPKLASGVTGVDIEHGEFHVKSIESGSLTEDIIVSFFFKDRAAMDAYIVKIGGNRIVKTVVIAALLAAAVAYGLHLVAAQPAPNITASNNVIINIGAGEVKLTPEAFEAIVRTVVSDKKDVAQNALKFVTPSRADPRSSVTFGEPTERTIEISASAIAESPPRIELARNERLEEHYGAVLSIRATNLDSKKIGWAGKLGYREERLPIELDPSVNEADVFGRTTLTVDAAMIFRESGKGRQLKPAKIYVRRVVKTS